MLVFDAYVFDLLFGFTSCSVFLLCVFLNFSELDFNFLWVSGSAGKVRDIRHAEFTSLLLDLTD